MQLQREFGIFIIGVHCRSHKTNVAMHVVSKIAIVSKGVALFSTLHAYFSKSPKKSMEFSKLVEIMETKGSEILKHCKTLWVDMLTTLKQILSEWPFLTIKMELDYSIYLLYALYHLLYDIESLFGMACILLLFEVVQSLRKFGQSRDVALYDFVAIVKQCHIIVGVLYVHDNLQQILFLVCFCSIFYEVDFEFGM